MKKEKSKVVYLFIIYFLEQKLCKISYDYHAFCFQKEISNDILNNIKPLQTKS